MKWFFRITALIFALFALAVAIGAFLPGVQVVERSAVIDADSGTVFDTLNDLSTYPQWSYAVPSGTRIAFGDTVGNGASAAWETGTTVGSAQIVQSVPTDLVLVAVRDGERMQVLTFALAAEGERTLLVAKQERELGGFPFLDRVAAKLQAGGVRQDLDDSLARLNAAIPGA